MELARLFGAASEPAAGTGGRGRAAFGLDFAAGGRVRLDTQPGADTALMRCARMKVRTDLGARQRGTFSALRATARAANGWAAVRVDHRFTPASIAVTHRIRARRSRVVTVRFPVWGEQGGFHVVNRGRSATIARVLRATRGSALVARAGSGGYAATFTAVPRGTTIRVLGIRAQASSPQVRRVAIARFKLRRGRSATIGVRLRMTA